MANIKWSAFTSGGDLEVGDQVVGMRAGDNRRFTFPSIGFKDASGNYLLGWSAVAGAVNYLTVVNSATGNAPVLIPTGTDPNIGLLIKSVGSGNITLTPGIGGTVITSSALILNTSSPTTALQAASKGYVDSVIPAFPVSLANGGTNASLTASNGGIFYSTATAGAILAGTATANQVLMSGVSSAPSWSTAVYPATTTINQLLYSSATNTITGLATANNGVLITSNTGVPSLLANTGVTGNMLHSNSAAAPSWSTSTYADTYLVNNILFASSANTVTGLATANSGVLITSAGGVPSISSTLPAAVQGNITTVGTISSGVWNGTIIDPAHGGTGVNNGTSTITLAGSLTTVGSFPVTFNFTAGTNVTFPTSGTLLTSASVPTLPISLANGGTNANLTASNGGIVYSGASAFAVLAGTATADQILMSGSNTSPAWSTATYPPTTTINQLLYSSAANTITGVTVANSSVLVTSASGVPSWSTTLPALTTIEFGTGNGIHDTNNKELLTFSTAANAVNFINLSNAATGANPSVNASGSDSNVGLILGMKGTGSLNINSANTTTPFVVNSGTGLQHSTNFNFANTAGTKTVTFPDASGTVTLGGITQVIVQTFVAGGTYTPTTGMQYCDVYVTAGGGGGAGAAAAATGAAAGGGGGAGGTSIKWGVTAAAVGASQTITVGAGGAGGTAGANNGSTGGVSSFGAIITTAGGLGGAAGSNQTLTFVPIIGGAGGAAGSGGSVNHGGGAGGSSGVNGVSIILNSGIGGSSYWGGGALGVNTSAAGNAGTALGSGGSGAGATVTTNRAGGNGAGGVVVVVEYI